LDGLFVTLPSLTDGFAPGTDQWAPLAAVPAVGRRCGLAPLLTVPLDDRSADGKGHAATRHIPASAVCR